MLNSDDFVPAVIANSEIIIIALCLDSKRCTGIILYNYMKVNLQQFAFVIATLFCVYIAAGMRASQAVTPACMG